MTTQIVSSGVVSHSLTVSGGDELLVLSGGLAAGATVLNSGTERLSFGALAESVTVSAGGFLVGPGRVSNVIDYGLVSGVILAASSFADIRSGGVASGDVLRGLESVESGGLDLGEVIENGGSAQVQQGGQASGVTIRAGGVLQDLGVLSAAHVASGGVLEVEGTASGDIVSSGGREIVDTISAVDGDSILSGATLVFDSKVVSGQSVTFGDVVKKTVFDGVTLSSGAIAVSEALTILSGGKATLAAGATVGFAIISAGGLLVGGAGALGDGGDFGSVTGVRLGPQGFFDVERGGVASGVRVGSDAFDYVLAGGVDHGAVVGSGGFEWVLAGGHASDDLITSGGSIVLESRAVVSGDVVGRGGDLVFAGDVESGQVIVVTPSVASATLIDGVTLSAGAHLRLNGVTILSGATVSVRAGAAGVAGTVSAGGVLSGPGAAVDVNDFGLLAGVLVTNNGNIVVESSGVAQRDIMSDGGSEIVRGETLDDIVRSGGVEQVNKGGLASATTVSQGGAIRLFSGTASGTRLLGGIETIVAGVAIGTVISGGYEFDYGVASGTQVRSGGHEKVANDAIASGSVISGGGREVVSSGGVAAGATISGGTLIVLSGGAISGGLTIHAGNAIIAGTMAAGQTATFTGAAGVLALDNLAGFHAAVSGLATPNEKIDLVGLAFSSSGAATWTQAGTSGTLLVHDGAQSASLTLIGAYASSDFRLAGDGHGGTLVTGAHPSSSTAPAATRFVEAVAGFGGGRGAASFTVHAGGAPLGASPLVAQATSGR